MEAPGTFAGVVERLDYLAGLGVNAIELMPIHEFNELEYYQASRGERISKGVRGAWGTGGKGSRSRGQLGSCSQP